MLVAQVALVAFAAAFSAAAQTNVTAAPATAAATAAAKTSPAELSEQWRARCIAGRRSICGKILKIFPNGILVEGGYTNLLRAPLTKSWLVPGSVVARRAPDLVESREPGALCVGTIFLTDLPRGKPHQYDYVILAGYPTGEFSLHLRRHNPENGPPLFRQSGSGGQSQSGRRGQAGHEMNFPRRLLPCAGAAFVFFAAATAVSAAENPKPFGLAARPGSKSFLQMPPRADGAIPKLLSQTGAFKNVREFSPADDLIPYDLVVPFWSDGAEKSRFISVPQNLTIKFSPAGEWVFPRGTVFVKTFFLATNELNPTSLRRLETRLLVCDETGGVYGVTYKWRADDSDADLLATNLTEDIRHPNRDRRADANLVLSEPAGLPDLPHRERRPGPRRQNPAAQSRFHISLRRHRQRTPRVEPRRLV